MILPSHQEAIRKGEVKEEHDQLVLSEQLYHWLEKIALEVTERKSIFSFWKKKEQPTLGFYIYGKSGRGKTVITQFFMQDRKKIVMRRLHFHDFMHQLHKKLFEYRQENTAQDPLLRYVKELALEVDVLLFDEFFVINIADAMILSRFMQALNHEKVYIITTSNFAPETLYENGLQRDRFYSFIDYVKNNWHVHHMGGEKDYRLQHAAHEHTYFIDDKESLRSIFMVLNKDQEKRSRTVYFGTRKSVFEETMGRSVYVDFEQLFLCPLSANDYSILCQYFSHFYIFNIPILNNDLRDGLKRLITFIDVIAEKEANLFVSAAVELENLFQTSLYPLEVKRCKSRMEALKRKTFDK